MSCLFRSARACMRTAALAAFTLLPLTAAAQSTGADLAKARACMACHQVDSKRVGPAYINVATKYAATPDAATRLEQSIRKGSANKWGKIPMPAQTQVSEEEAKRLAQWILSLKP